MAKSQQKDREKCQSVPTKSQRVGDTITLEEEQMDRLNRWISKALFDMGYMIC